MNAPRTEMAIAMAIGLRAVNKGCGALRTAPAQMPKMSGRVH